MLSQTHPQEDPLLPTVVCEEAERAGEVELPYRSYDDIMEKVMAGDHAGVTGVGAGLLQPQQAGEAKAKKL